MNKLICLISVMAFLASCEKELDFKYHEVESQLVIEGNTTAEGTSVLLTRTCPMGEPMDITPITNAEVVLSDLTAGTEKILEAGKDGVFYDPDPGIPGHEYGIKVTEQGHSYLSKCFMPPATQILNLEFQWIKMPYDYVAVLQITFLDLPSEDDCYWIKIYKNKDPYMWLLTDDRSAINGVINLVTMTSRQDLDEEDEHTALRDGDAVEVIVSPVSRSMYDYLTAIQSDSNGPCMFEGGFCLGYYLASSNSGSSIVFHPDEMKEYK